MAEIKSAYERAMERFQDVEPDRDSLRQKGIKDKGKLVCAQVLQGEENQIAKVYSEYNQEEKGIFVAGIGETLLAQIAIPHGESSIMVIDAIKVVLSEIYPDVQDAVSLLDQYRDLSEQYLENKTELTEQIKAQYMQYMQKRGQQQSNMEANLMQGMQEQLKQLDEQYEPSFSQIKVHFAQLLGLSTE